MNKIMHTQLINELLNEKDPETLIRKVHLLDCKILSEIVGDDELISYMAKVFKDNPEIKERVRQEVHKEEQA